MKKIVLFILALFFLLPSAFAEDLEIVSYQKLKNITKSDHPAGSNLSMGFSGDEIRFLVFIQNKSETKKSYRVEDILPDGLIYQQNTTSLYELGSGGSWQKIQDNDGEKLFPLQDYVISINSGIGFYFTFSTIVSDSIPANNLALSNFVNIYSSADKVLKRTVTKVLVPNSTVQQVESQTALAEEENYVNKVLEEEQEFIEKTFFALEKRGFEAELPEKENLNFRQNQDKEELKNQKEETIPQTCNQIILCLIAVVVLILLLFYLQSKFGGGNHNNSKF